MEQSADQLAAFARRVLSATGAAKVSFVGHSQGGIALAARPCATAGCWAGREDVVGLAPSSHGTTNPLALPAGRPLLPGLRWTSWPARRRCSTSTRRRRRPAAVDWTVVSTRYDEVVTPYRSQALAGVDRHERRAPGPLPPRRHRPPRDHLRPRGAAVDARRLRRAGPADPAFRPACV